MPIGMEEGTPDGTVDYYMPNVLTVSDYEPFGAPLENRTASENIGYRFGFNGVEKENDLNGEGNAYAFEYRIHNPRIGRFLSVDPLGPEYPWNSTYAFAENKVIWGKDLEGRELSFLTDEISNYILNVVDASDLDPGTKGLIGYGVGIYQGLTYAADPGRMVYDQLNLSFQSLKTGLPLALQVIQKGSITPQEAKAIGMSTPLAMMINGKLEQIHKADEISADGGREAGKLSVEVILLFTAAKSGLKSTPGKTIKPAIVEPEIVPAAEKTPSPSNSSRASTLEPGPYAGESVPATMGKSRNFTQVIRDRINEIGQNSGCHTCGTKDPGTKSGNFIPDHQPPNSLIPDGTPQQLYPHCKSCSSSQGGTLSAIKRSKTE